MQGGEVRELVRGAEAGTEEKIQQPSGISQELLSGALFPTSFGMLKTSDSFNVTKKTIEMFSSCLIKINIVIQSVVALCCHKWLNIFTSPYLGHKSKS